MSTAAAIYIGAYTIQMLIARLEGDSEPEIINEFTAYTRIGENLDKTNLLTAEGMELAAKALKEMHEAAKYHKVDQYSIVASGSLRNAINRASLFVLCNNEFGCFPQLLSNKDEARLHFAGTVTNEFAALPIIVAYIGHYGVRIACGTMNGIDIVSEIPVGPGVLNKKFQIDTSAVGFFGMRKIMTSLKEDFQTFSSEYNEWKSKVGFAPELFLVGPFPTAYVSLALEMPVIDKNNIPSMPFPRRDLISLSRKIAAMPPEKRQKLPYLDQNMANSIAACAMIQRAIVDTCGMNEFRVSPNGLCMGVLKLLPTLLF